MNQIVTDIVEIINNNPTLIEIEMDLETYFAEKISDFFSQAIERVDLELIQEYKEKGYEFLNHGPEGYLWEWEGEEGGSKVFNDEIEQDNREDYRGTLTPAYGITVPTLTVELDPIGGEKSEFNEFLTQETQDKIETNGEVIFPLVYLTKEEQDEVNTIQVDLETFVVEREAAFITGNIELNDETWNDYISTLEQIGVRRLEEIHQDAYDRWLEAGE